MPGYWMDVRLFVLTHIGLAQRTRGTFTHSDMTLLQECTNHNQLFLPSNLLLPHQIEQEGQCHNPCKSGRHAIHRKRTSCCKTETVQIRLFCTHMGTPGNHMLLLHFRYILCAYKCIHCVYARCTAHNCQCVLTQGSEHQTEHNA